MSHFLVSHVSSVLARLVDFSSKPPVFLLGVSGGSDSIALLNLLYALKKKLNFKMFVVTVNHNIRPSEEGTGDVDFVCATCEKDFSDRVDCLVVEIPKGKIEKIKSIRGKGIEEAARFLRYKAFDGARAFFSADYVLTAHTKDDFYEGILMSFFRGSSPKALLGMEEKRGCYLKPLLGIKKETLRKYLVEKGISWREDQTNNSASYLRNRVRLSLIPAIQKVFPSWIEGISKVLTKFSIDEHYIEDAYRAFLSTHSFWKKSDDGSIYSSSKDFFLMPKAFRIRFLQEGLILLSIGYRVSYFSILKFIDVSKDGDEVCENGLSLSTKGNRLILMCKKKKDMSRYSAKIGYMFWIFGDKDICIGGNIFHIKKNGEYAFVISESDAEMLGPFKLPFCIRSRLPGDVIRISGKIRTIKSIFSKWRIASNLSSILPIVEEGGVLKAIYGKVMGAKNLIGD